MFCAVYEFKIMPDKHECFREEWHEITQMMIQEFDSLGARLHENEDGTWIAYAQWPNKEKWEVGHRVIDERVRQLHFENCLAAIPTTLLKLTLIDDLLQFTKQDLLCCNRHRDVDE